MGSAKTTNACASGSDIAGRKRWCTPMCSTILPKTSGRGSKLCAVLSPTMPTCWRSGRTRAFRTSFTSACRRNDRHILMGFKCGILGLSNVGKSTLFNALTATAAAQASNYPFSTIEPNVGEVMVPDPRLDVLAKLAKSARIKPTRLTFVDIAGLVSGASKGEGLGNQFLAHI